MTFPKPLIFCFGDHFGPVVICVGAQLSGASHRGALPASRAFIGLSEVFYWRNLSIIFFQYFSSNIAAIIKIDRITYIRYLKKRRI